MATSECIDLQSEGDDEAGSSEHFPRALQLFLPQNMSSVWACSSEAKPGP